MTMDGIGIHRVHSLLLSALALIAAWRGQRSLCLAQQVCDQDADILSRVENLADARALGAAVNCSDGGTVEVVWAGPVTLDAPISIGSGTNLSISGQDALAEVQGDSQVRLFDVSPGGGLELTNLTLSGGSAASGGAIRSSMATVTLDSCVFDGNFATAGDGGAVWAEGGALTVVGGTFVNNEATGSGGAVRAADGLVIRKGTVFKGNGAGVDGGALYCGGAETTKTARCTLSQAMFTSNSASGDADSAPSGSYGGSSDTSYYAYDDPLAWLDFYGGGAAAFYGAVVDITDSVFEFNDAQVSGGAIFGGSGSEITVNGCTFRNNTTSGYGAAIAASSVTLGGGTLVTYNEADTDGGGVSDLFLVVCVGRGLVVVFHRGYTWILFAYFGVILIHDKSRDTVACLVSCEEVHYLILVLGRCHAKIQTSVACCLLPNSTAYCFGFIAALLLPHWRSRI